MLIVSLSGSVNSQNYLMIKGSVFNLRGESLVGAHAINISRNYGTFTDFSGHFTLILAKNDSLKVSMIGYKPFTLKIPENLNALNYSLNITLLTDTLIISGPDIRPYPATYAEFRQEFVTMQTPEEKITKAMNLPTEPFRRRYENPEGGLLLPGPFSLIYDNFSKEAKQKKKMAAIQSKNNLRKKFLEIVLLETLAIRYQCETDQDVDDLLQFCGVDMQMLKSTPQYIIAKRIDECGPEWKRRKTEALKPQ
jgi:hypothetical protein